MGSQSLQRLCIGKLDYDQIQSRREDTYANKSALGVCAPKWWLSIDLWSKLLYCFDLLELRDRTFPVLL